MSDKRDSAYGSFLDENRSLREGALLSDSSSSVSPSEEGNCSNDDHLVLGELEVKNVQRNPMSLTQLNFNVKMPNFGGRRLCVSTDGEETVLESIKRNLKARFPASKKHFDKMFFYSSNNEYRYYNLGLLTRYLNEEETFTCIFEDSKYNTTAPEFIRLYDVANYQTNTRPKSFFVSFNPDTKPSFQVSPFQRLFKGGVVKVDFLEGETLFDALYKDGRFGRLIHKSDSELEFDKDIIKQYGLVNLDNNSDVYIGDFANNFEGKKFQVIKKANGFYTPPGFHANSQHDLSVKQESAIDAATLLSGDLDAKLSVSPAANEHSKRCLKEDETFIPTRTSTPSSYKAKHFIQGKKDFVSYFEETFKLSTKERKNKREENKRLKKIDDFVRPYSQNFSQELSHRTYISDLERLCMIAKSVGAIVLEQFVGVPQVIGTCFRIGTNYVMTCYHVAIKIMKSKMTIPKDHFPRAFYVTFNFNRQNPPSQYSFPKEDRFFFDEYPYVVYSKDLDYAILRLDVPQEQEARLPGCITSHGFEFPAFVLEVPMGEGMTFIGHPEGPGNMPKQTDTFCPVDQPSNLDEKQKLFLHFKPQLVDPTRGHYHVKSFFHGSSGAPGLHFESNLVMVLHARGFFLQTKSSIEQGVFMPAILEDVKRQIEEPEGEVKIGFEEMFPRVRMENNSGPQNLYQFHFS